MPERFKFIKTTLEALPSPATGRATVYDTLVPKLALRITSAGSKAFYVVKRDGARMAWIRIGSFPQFSPEQARDKAQEHLGEYAKGNDPVQVKRAQKQRQTLGEAFEQYMDLHAVPEGIKGAGDLRALWERCVGTMPMAEKKKHGRPRAKHPAGVDWTTRKIDTINPSDVRHLRSAIGATHPTMANRVIELVSTVYNRAIEWGYKGENPTAGIKPFKEEKRDRFIQSEELPRFFEALRDDSSIDFQHFVLLALLTGARRTNVMAMQWEDISMERATWRIPTTKNGDPVTVPLVDEALTLLRARLPVDTSVIEKMTPAKGFVFPAASKAGHISPPKKRWQALIARAGIADLRIHDLRRSLGSWQAITGASLSIIGKSLGHRSADATMIYARLSMDPVRAAVNTATSAMLEAGGMKKAAEVKPIRRKKTAA